VKKITWILPLLLVACEWGASGNGTWSPTQETADPVSSVLQFKDIPTPRNFVLEAEISISREWGNRRFGKLVYYGSMEINEVVSFMMEQLEFQQWVFKSKSLREGETALFFSKGTEELEVYIKSSRWKTRLEIVLG
jgi:hypothetical protein